METIQTRIADATARLSLVTSSRRYLDRQIRGAYTPTSTKPSEGDPGCLLLCDGSILCKPPPSTALPSPRVSCLLCLLPLPPLFPFNPFHLSSHIPIFTHHRTVLSSLVLPTPTSFLRYHFLLLLLRPSLPSRRCHRRLFYPRWPRP